MYIHTKTIFCDIDGCIFRHEANFFDAIPPGIPSPLPGVKEKLLDWHCKGYRIILTTGRPECMRPALEKSLADFHILYHQLLMDCGSGIRVLINDIDPKFPDNSKAVAINLERNKGIGGIGI